MKAIFFDLDGTLLHFTRDYGDVLADAVEAVGGEVAAESLEAYDEAFVAGFAACEPEPVRNAFRASHPEADADALVDSLRGHEIEMCEPPENAAADLERLGEGFRLGVLTNGVPAWQRAKLEADGLAEYFDAFVASYDAGAHKPDPEPFELAEERLFAEDYAMVGDADADVDGARNAGWIAHRYEGEGFGGLPDAIDWG